MTIEDRAIDPARPFAAEHVRQYLECNGASVDHPAAGHLILLYTTGRVSGQIRRTPLRFFEVGDDLVVAASYGGAPEHPDWYLNLLADPQVWVRHDADLYPATAVALDGDERDRLWDAVVVSQAPQFADYQAKTPRVIPLVRLVATD
ncbi:MAG TPA: nitroreductase family deazaflavin-dependent oxidoreductase [Acidimicrobiia bacterium]|nr:nitroreductase family deazaflavin-dependent oxidoreductase [Acidimicrobiia bacterium]